MKTGHLPSSGSAVIRLSYLSVSRMVRAGDDSIRESPVSGVLPASFCGAG
jgi:hypothetical protein